MPASIPYLRESILMIIGAALGGYLTMVTMGSRLDHLSYQVSRMEMAVDKVQLQVKEFDSLRQDVALLKVRVHQQETDLDGLSYLQNPLIRDKLLRLIGDAK